MDLKLWWHWIISCHILRKYCHQTCTYLYRESDQYLTIHHGV